MPNPNSRNRWIRIDMLIVVGSVPTFGFSNPLFVSQFSPTPAFPGRIKEYSGSSDAILSAAIDDGFSSTSVVYRQLRAGLSSTPKIGSIYIGREDPLDASVTDTMNAISAENSDGWYSFAYDTRDKTKILELANWAEPTFHWYMGLSKDQDIIDQTPGNIGELLHDAGYERTALIYRDSISVAQAAMAQTAAETFPFYNGIQLIIKVDGGLGQPVTWTGTAASQTSANAGPFDLAPNDNLLIKVDGEPEQNISILAKAASVTTNLSEPFELAPDQKVAVKVDGGPVKEATFIGTAGQSDAQNAENYDLNDGENLLIAADGNPAVDIVFDAADFPNIDAVTASEAAQYINVNHAGVFAFAEGGVLKVRSRTFGSGSSVEVQGGSANAAFGFNLVLFPGAGDAVNLAAATAQDVVDRLNTDLTGLVATDEGGRVKVTSDTFGTSSQIQVTGGTANLFLQFPQTPVSGAGDVADIDAATSDELVAKFSSAIVGATSSKSGGGEVVISSLVEGLASKIEITGGTMNAVLGFPLGEVQGAGNVQDLKNVTAQEVANQILADVNGLTAEVAGLKVKISSNIKGEASQLEFSGDAQAILQLPDQVNGIGTDEDYADCAYLGRMLVLDLDARQGNWNNQPIPGYVGDPLTEATKNYLKSKSINFLDKAAGNTVFRWGTMAKREFYIDQRTTVDWLHARLSEAYDAWFLANAQALQKIPFTQDGINAAQSVARGIFVRAEGAGHIDGRWRDLMSFPLREDIPVADLNARKLRFIELGGFFVPGINEIEVTVKLQVG